MENFIDKNSNTEGISVRRWWTLYFSLGACWVLLGDALLTVFTQDTVQLSSLRLWTEGVYVVVTGVLAWWLLRRAECADQLRVMAAKRTAQILRHVPAGIALIAIEGHILWANQHLCKLTGMPLDTLQKKGFREAVCAPDRGWIQEQQNRLLAGEIDHYQGECQCEHADTGAIVPVMCTVTMVPSAQNQPAHLVCVVQDISAIYAARTAEERQRLAATVVDNTLEGVVVTDAESRILSVNTAFTRMLGYTESELLGKTPREFKSGRHDSAFYQAMWETMHRTGHWQGEIWNQRKNGEVFPEHMSLSSVCDIAGVISHYVCIFSDISAEKAQQERLEYLAHCDTLTGLFNRVWFRQQLERAVEQARVNGEMMGVLLINLDRFKDVNDSYGHAVGDQVLQHLAHQVSTALRPGDLLGRLAGDEMAVVVRNLRHADGAAAVARHLLTAVAEPWHSPAGFNVVAGASVGICMFPEHAKTAELLLQGAHSAVYGAKAHGRGALCFFAEAMTQAARERLELEARLRHALAQEQLLVYYQPQVDIATGRIIGAEALLRWPDPQEGMISPARFIPVAESSGVIGPLGEWVLRQACLQGKCWLDAGLPAVTIAVNVSPRQFVLTDLVACASAVLADTGFPAAHLELEITESALADRFAETLLVLQGLCALGLRLAVDDFGTGYSSLAHLKRFPIHVLKIDQGFIRDIPTSTDDMAISSAIIAMGHSMGLSVLAEGVETPEQLEFLRVRGCDSYQGFFLSRPVPPAEFALLLQAQSHPTAP